MNSTTHKQAASSPKQLVTDNAVKLLASAIYRQLQDEGCAAKDIISVSSQLIGMVTTELQQDEHQS